MTQPPSEDRSQQQRQDIIERLYVEGLAQFQIADNVSVPLEVLLEDLRAIRTRWLASFHRGVNEAVAQELGKLDHLEAVAWQAWQRSCQPTEATKVVSDGDKKRAERTVKQEVGDATFLTRVSWCIEKRCKLLGLDDPQQRQAGAKDQVDVGVARAQIGIDSVLAEIGRRLAIADTGQTPDDTA